MVTRTQALVVLEKLKAAKPSKTLKDFDGLDRGLDFVLIYLSEHNNVYATTLSEEMCISRARIAVLLAKLENRGFICKLPSPTDARIEVVEITQAGHDEVARIKENAIKRMMKIIDVVGSDEIDNFVNTLIKICSIVESQT